MFVIVYLSTSYANWINDLKRDKNHEKKETPNIHRNNSSRLSARVDNEFHFNIIQIEQLTKLENNYAFFWGIRKHDNKQKKNDSSFYI